MLLKLLPTRHTGTVKPGTHTSWAHTDTMNSARQAHTHSHPNTRHTTFTCMDPRQTFWYVKLKQHHE